MAWLKPPTWREPPPPYLHVGFVPSGFVEPSPTKAGCAKGAALLSTDLVKVRELLSFPFRTPTVKKLSGTEKEKGKKPTTKHTFCHGLRREKDSSEVKKSLR